MLTRRGPSASASGGSNSSVRRLETLVATAEARDAAEAATTVATSLALAAAPPAATAAVAAAVVAAAEAFTAAVEALTEAAAAAVTAVEAALSLAAAAASFARPSIGIIVHCAGNARGVSTHTHQERSASGELHHHLFTPCAAAPPPYWCR